MKVKADRLPAHLAQTLAPVYLVAGAEPLLVQECRDQVIHAAQQRGFAERDLYQADGRFDWDRLDQASANLSLFSSLKIVDIRLPGGKPGREGAAALVEMVAEPDPDRLLIVSCESWDASSRKSKWASQLEKSGVLVEIWPVKPHELPGWIRNRMRRAGLEPEPGAVELLAELVEGNLLAAQQEIDKLLLLGGSKRVREEEISIAVADSTRFDSFRLVECVLQGNLVESLRVASGLRRTNVPIQLVCGSLHRELMLAETAQRALDSGGNESAVFRQLQVWPARQGPMRQAIQRLARRGFGDAFRGLALIDRQSKGRADGDPWQSLDRLLCDLCERPDSTRRWMAL
jgi:DNA polymerase-3 subunit delta